MIEIACTECDRRVVYNDEAIAFEGSSSPPTAALNAGWAPSHERRSGRHTLWMLCPTDHERGE
jgi:hypothetical protein